MKVTLTIQSEWSTIIVDDADVWFLKKIETTYIMQTWDGIREILLQTNDEADFRNLCISVKPMFPMAVILTPAMKAQYKKNEELLHELALKQENPTIKDNINYLINYLDIWDITRFSSESIISATASIISRYEDSYNEHDINKQEYLDMETAMIMVREAITNQSV